MNSSPQYGQKGVLCCLEHVSRRIVMSQIHFYILSSRVDRFGETNTVSSRQFSSSVWKQSPVRDDQIVEIHCVSLVCCEKMASDSLKDRKPKNNGGQKGKRTEHFRRTEKK